MITQYENKAIVPGSIKVRSGENTCPNCGAERKMLIDGCAVYYCGTITREGKLLESCQK